MTDFDTRLRDRLRALDAAIPEPAPFEPLLAERRPNRRRRVMIVLAAAALLTAATALATVATSPPRTPAEEARDAALEKRLSEDIGSRTEDGCFSADEMTALVEERLAAFGLEGWTLRRLAGVDDARCVSLAVVAADEEVILMPGLGGDLAQALDGLMADTREQCYQRDEAVELVRATLVKFGETDPRVVVMGLDDPPVALPGEGTQAYVEHIKAGCYVYESGQRWDASGNVTFIVRGP